MAGAAAAIAVPRIEEGKERGAEREAERAAALDAAHRQRLERDQRSQRARAPSAGRNELVAALERSITRDARSRVARGELRGRIAGTSCERARGRVYDCLAVTGRFRGRLTSGASGYPFRAVVDFRDRSYVWCKTNPPPGEGGVPDPRELVELPRECVG